MTVLKKFKRYEYPIKDEYGNSYMGSYTVYDSVEPTGEKGERLVQTFTAWVKGAE